MYTLEQIKENKLYGDVMQAINELYIKSGSPEMLDDSGRKTTTGNSHEEFWSAGSLGDWDGKEEKIASEANSYLDDVYNELGIMGNGGIFYYYRTDEWDKFADDAVALIDDFHQDGAYETLQDIYA